MARFIIFCLFFLGSIQIFAQWDKSDFERFEGKWEQDSFENVFLEKTIELPGLKKEEIYRKAID